MGGQRAYDEVAEPLRLSDQPGSVPLGDGVGMWAGRSVPQLTDTTTSVGVTKG